MRGRRVDPNPDGSFRLEPGDYCRDNSGVWWACAPVQGEHYAGTLTDHDVIEHEDGTITVSPSLVFGNSNYHGWLKAGVWTDA